jgi:NAD(P)-dependent dehydrogenase (short-subunit alcohol dehydrogenase family)
MGKLDGKVAFISGAARGQGRSHAIRLAQEGADIIAVDVCETISANLAYEMSTPEDLAQTVREVEALDRRIVARKADVRDADALRAVLDDGQAELGPVGIVLANAGIAAARPGRCSTGVSPSGDRRGHPDGGYRVRHIQRRVSGREFDAAQRPGLPRCVPVPRPCAPWSGSGSATCPGRDRRGRDNA